MKNVYCIARIFNNKWEIIEHNGNTYLSLAEAISGNLRENDIVHNILLDEISCDVEEATYYYTIFLQE